MPHAALITGGAKRIGRAIALALAEDGCDVALHFNTSSEEADDVAAEIRRLGRRCEQFACDLADSRQVLRLMPAVFEAMPGCDLLVNNASIFRRVGLLETDEAVYDAHFAIHCKAPFFLSRDFAGGCAGAGQIINILDTRVADTPTAHFAYALSKKTLYEFTRMAARALGPRIRVNAVCPGLILPPPGEDESWLERLSADLPLKRHGGVDDVVAAVRFLLAGEFITGEAIFVDGGQHL